MLNPLIHYRTIARLLGWSLVGISQLNLVPMLLGHLDGDGTTQAFLTSWAVSGSVGLVLALLGGNQRTQLNLRDGFLLTSSIWVAVCISASLPFMLAPPNLSFVDALFEATSGITTTGATLIVGLDLLPRSVLFYRQSLHFIGGMGIVVLAVALLPILRVGGQQLFKTESSKAVKESKLTPRMAETAKMLWVMYIILNVICTVFYWASGMSFFDAVGHAFSTIATAGFSTHDASIGYFNSPLIEVVTMIFMTIGGINFALHFIAIRRASAQVYFQDKELHLYLGILLICGLVVGGTLVAYQEFSSPLDAVRHGFFQVIASMTTTGFGTTGFYAWPGALPIICILISFLGGCAGSTTGGLKLRRVALLMKVGFHELKQLVHPHSAAVVQLSRQAVDDATIRAIAGFVALYFFTLTAFIIALASTGLDLVTAASAAAACLNNLGPALGEAGANFESLPNTPTAILTLAMILGRLEILTLLVLLTPGFWRD